MSKSYSQISAIVLIVMGIIAVECLAKQDQTRRRDNPFFPKTGEFVVRKPDLVIQKFGIDVDPQYRDVKHLKVWLHNVGHEPADAGVRLSVNGQVHETVEWSIPPGVASGLLSERKRPVSQVAEKDDLRSTLM